MIRCLISLSISMSALTAQVFYNNPAGMWNHPTSNGFQTCTGGVIQQQLIAYQRDGSYDWPCQQSRVTQSNILQLETSAPWATSAGFYFPVFAIDTSAPIQTCTLSPMAGSSLGGAAGCDYYRLPTSQPATFGYSWYYTTTFGPTTVFVYVLDIPIPSDPALIDTWVMSQAFRIDNATGLIVASDRHDAKIV